jgi:hypothetical protein
MNTCKQIENSNKILSISASVAIKAKRKRRISVQPLNRLIPFAEREKR